MRFKTLDSWRGMCALLVVFYHADGHGPIAGSSFIRGAFLFVDFFFVLSGFVMAEAYAGRIRSGLDFRVFLLRRFGRVWPLHMAMILAFLALELVKVLLVRVAHVQFTNAPFTATMSLDALVPNILLVHAMGLLPGLTWNGPSWSIAAEFWTYVVFGVVSWRVRARTELVAALIAICAAAVLVATSTRDMDVTYDLGYMRCLYGFFIGVSLHRVTAAWRAEGKPLGTLVEAIVTVGACLFVAMAHGTPYSYLSPLVFACAIAVFANSNGALSRGLQTTPFLNLGTWSYSIYMTHIFILSAANMLSRMIEKVAAARHVGDQWRAAIAAPGVSDALCFLFALVVIGVSSQTFRWIEAPAQRFFNARARALT